MNGLGGRAIVVQVTIQARDVQVGDVVWDIPSLNSSRQPNWRQVAEIMTWVTAEQVPMRTFKFDDGTAGGSRDYGPVLVQVMHGEGATLPVVG